MKEEFIPYEQALALKYLEFNEVCLASYNNLTEITRLILGKTDTGSITWNKTPDKYNAIINSNERILAPLYQQAFGFLLKKLDDTSINMFGDGSGSIIESCMYGENYNTQFNNKTECLNELIKLCQSLKQNKD